MTISQLLNQTKHRSSSLTDRPWAYHQEWNNVVFLHWKVSKTLLSLFVPSELELEKIKGDYWVSIVLFTMEKARPKGFPNLSFVSDFDEVNLRTYVKFKEKSGIYFLNIEAGKRFASWIANRLSGLPYHFSKMNRTKTDFNSDNSSFKDHIHIKYQSGDSIDNKNKSELDVLLTERYAVFEKMKNKIIVYDVHHVEWPLQKIELKNITFTSARFQPLISRVPDHTGYSKGVEVLAWNKEWFDL